ncbi:S9 family peptidase [Catenulispora subtropica]|uniref:S9 family peptidase n=1 Tax=Catenulispora subtropica TaxID=450798 RepID=A0ABN2T812_9ACTN
MEQEDQPLEDATWVARQKVSIDELTFAAGVLWWLQNSPSGGKTQLMRSSGAEAPVPVTPPGLAIGGWLHGYGGGSYAVGDDGVVWFIDGTDSGLRRLNPESGHVEAVTGEGGFLFGDLSPAPGGVLAVRGCDGGDELVLCHAGESSVQVLLRSAGFLGAPRLLGDHLAVLEWDEDQMPWDGSRLLVSRLVSDGVPESPKVIAGGVEESVVQPMWGPDGELYYLSDRSGWWNLYRWDGVRHRAVAPMDFDCAPAPWEAGYQSFAFLADGRIALTVQDGLSHRLVIAAADGTVRDVDVPLTSIKPYVAAHAHWVAVIGSASAEPPAVVDVNVDANVAPASSPAVVSAKPAAVAGEHRRVPGRGQLRFLMHRPSVDEPVPLIIRAHAGPTDEVRDRLDWTKQYFVAHGFAVAEVVYRGSAGLGRAFRTCLNGNWGTFDVEDCLAVARHLVSEGLAVPGAVFLSGSSAGGYTALQAACVQDSPLAAVTAISAIVDPVGWATTAPRFQRAHARTLAGPAGAVRAEKVRIPVLLMHGRGDQVATVADAEALAGELSIRDRRHEALFFDDVGHYLSKPEVLAQALRAELAFYRRFTD